MTQKEFTVDAFKVVLADLFEVEKNTLADEYDLSVLIKDSIDLGELVATVKATYGVEPTDWERFKTETSLQAVFANFVLPSE